MSFVEIIARKRDGRILTREDVDRFVEAATRRQVPPEQISALLMAICCRGMSDEETRDLTDAMLRSGDRWRLADDWPKAVDKHSTGGVGDTVSLIYAPLMAAVGVPVAMMAGRGLGHTQGTLDKLHAIPGFDCERDRDGTLELLGECGAAIIAQTEEIAPADRVLYALRDVTGTVPSLPLIVSSIMSKKLALGAAALVLDVKWGSGAFCKTVPDAVELADALCRVGRELGVATDAFITDMNQPLGPNLGTASEVRSALQVLEGAGDDRLRDVTLALAERSLVLAGRDRAEARVDLEAALSDGKARAQWEKIVVSHGGDPDQSVLARPKHETVVQSETSGWIEKIDSEVLGWVAVELGAGRRDLEDEIDYAAGIAIEAKVGDLVEPEQPLAVLAAGERDVDLKLLESRVAAAFSVSAERVEPPRLVLGLLDELHATGASVDRDPVLG